MGKIARRSDGRWAKSRGDCTSARVKSWDDQQKLGHVEYYCGKGTGGRGTFEVGHGHSDGCSADFKCAGLLLFLSALFAIMLVWNWFASSHGKTDECDAGGGSFKRKVNNAAILVATKDGVTGWVIAPCGPSPCSN